MEIAPAIHRIVAPLDDRIVCVFALVGNRASLLIDSGVKGTPTEVIVPYFEEQGIDLRRLKWILISHADFDHYGGNGELRPLVPDAAFMCHPADRRHIESVNALIAERYGEFSGDYGMPASPEVDECVRQVTEPTDIDLMVQGGTGIRLGDEWWVDILHTAGHSRGHISVHDPRSNTAIIADAVLSTGLVTASGSAAFPPTYRYVEPYLSTIERIRALRPRVLATSHFPLLHGEMATDFLDNSVAYVERVDYTIRQVLQAASSPLTTPQIIDAVAPSLGPWTGAARDLLVHPVAGHLELLEHRGDVRRERRERAAVWHVQRKLA